MLNTASERRVELCFAQDNDGSGDADNNNVVDDDDDDDDDDGDDDEQQGERTTNYHTKREPKAGTVPQNRTCSSRPSAVATE